MGEEEEDWEAIERAHNRELLTRLVLQIAATCLTVWALTLPLTPIPTPTLTLTLSRDVPDGVGPALPSCCVCTACAPHRVADGFRPLAAVATRQADAPGAPACVV
eukprot:scaffold35363_cov56-Phaeocystis_antarctica.AAC.6